MSLLALQQVLGQQVAEVLDAALAIEVVGGTSDTWSGVLARHGVRALPEETRYETARAGGQTRGAPIEEARAVLAKISLGGQAALATLSVDADHRARLDTFLAQLPDEVCAHYRLHACKKARGMFGHAMATAHKHQYADIKSSAYVLKCPTCGGPRLKTEHFRCSYCGGKFT